METSSLAVVLSIVSVCISVASFVLQRRQPIVTMLLQCKQRSDKLLQKYPHLLALHGIDEKRLAKLEVLPEEVIYLLCSLETAHLHHLIKKELKFELEIFDRTLLRHPKVPVVWSEFVKERFADDQEFVQVVESALGKLGVESPA